MRSICWLTVLTILCSCGPVWTPPENPDPREILEKARLDYDEQRYEAALAKHIWFHENALGYMPAMAGVRLSYALNDLYKLGQVYEPAMDALISYRDAALNDILDKQNPQRSFQDYSAINWILDEDSLTAALFLQLDTLSPGVAEKVFGIAQPVLIKFKEYTVYLKYLDPDLQAIQLVSRFQEELQMAETDNWEDYFVEFTKNKFVHEATTMIAVLSLHGNKDEAVRLTNDFRNVFSDSLFHVLLDSALLGSVPDPWP